MFLEINPNTIQYNINTYNMSYKDIICDESIKSPELEYLRKMHELRYRVFVKKLKWTHGLEVVGNMEFDEFDHDECWHLMHIDDDGNVDVAMRFLETEKKYLLGDEYRHFIQNTEVPRDKNIYEVTRFAVDNSVNKKAFPLGIAAMISWSMDHNLSNLVSLTRIGMLKALSKIGWDPQPMGEAQKTPDDVSIALQYTVNREMLTSVCNKNDICPQSIEIIPQLA